jgi:hypothetical protein
MKVLKQIDIDEKFEYSKIISITCGLLNPIQVVPNPTNDFIEMIGVDGTQWVEIFDEIGHRSLSKTYNVGEKIAIEQLPVGVYMVRLTNQQTGFFQMVKFIKKE